MMELRYRHDRGHEGVQPVATEHVAFRLALQFVRWDTIEAIYIAAGPDDLSSLIWQRSTGWSPTGRRWRREYENGDRQQ